jgi:formyltetrahydrofolate deformylase
MGQLLQKGFQSFRKQNENKGHLLISCPDQPGIVASISTFLYEQGANIIDSSQYTIDPSGGTFFMRIEFECDRLVEKEEVLRNDFSPIAEKFSMDWRIEYAYHVKRMAVFVSKEEHCLLELLWEWQAGGFVADIPLVISNHEDLREIVEQFGIPFYYIPVTKGKKEEAEQEQLKLIEEANIDLIVLARYMQILSPAFIEMHPNEVINIHHSFLPAFVGAKPYHQAYERGVKLIGATSHYVTNDLDEGPIIEQDVERVNHKNHIEDLKRIGKTIERRVLARAVKWHLQNRIIVHGNKTIVF